MLPTTTVTCSVGNCCGWFWILVFTLGVKITSVLSLPNDWFGGNDSILFPRVRCLIAALRLGPGIGALEKYPTYFRDDSVMEVAQTGVYKGADNIIEYSKIIYEESPYMISRKATKSRFSFVGYENGQCVLWGIVSSTYIMDPNNCDAPPPFDVVSMGKIYLDFEQRYVSRVNIYFTDDFLRIIVDKIWNSVPTRNYICNVMKGPCMSILNTTQYDNGNTTCSTMLDELPTFDGTGYLDGNSQGCRAMHASFAEPNPTNHCAHLSFTPMLDPLGNIKCQASKNKLPSELFTEKDFQKYKKFAESVGIDPIIGHNSQL